MIFDPEHGYANGHVPVQCDGDNPSDHCLFHDGFTISRGAGSSPLYGAGGFFDGTSGANVAIVLDGDWGNPIGGGKLFVGSDQFFGVIDAGPVGLTEVQFRETDGKVGQQLLIFGDDFTLLAQPAVPVPVLDAPGVMGLALLLVITGGLGPAAFRRQCVEFRNVCWRKDRPSRSRSTSRPLPSPASRRIRVPRERIALGNPTLYPPGEVAERLKAAVLKVVYALGGISPRFQLLTQFTCPGRIQQP